MESKHTRRRFRGTLRTGNSFRYVHGRKSYQKTPFLVKQIRNVTRVESHNKIYSDIVEGDVKDINVLYSLNKKARWRLAEYLCDFVTECGRDENTPQISVYEFHKMHRSASCIKYATSKGPGQVIMPTRNKYIDIKSALDKPKHRQLRRPRRHVLAPQDEENSGVKEPPEADVTYCFMYPVPSDSCIAHASKFVSDDSSFYPRFFTRDWRKGRNSRAVRNRFLFNQAALDDDYSDDYSDDVIYDDYSDEIIDDDNIHDPPASLDSAELDLSEYDFVEDFFDVDEENIFETLLDRAIRASELCGETRGQEKAEKRRRRTTGSGSSGGSWSGMNGWVAVETKKDKGFSFYIDKDEAFVDLKDEPLSEGHRDRGASAPPEVLTAREISGLSKHARSTLRIKRESKIRDDEVFAEYLRHTSGFFPVVAPGDATALTDPKSTEQIPVTIVLKKAELGVVALGARFGSRYREGATLDRRFVVEITDEVEVRVNRSRRSHEKVGEVWSVVVFVYGGEHDEDSDIYRVSLNSDLAMTSVRIETLFDLQECSIDEVISAALCYIDTIPDYCFPKIEPPQFSKKDRFATLSLATLTSVNSWGTVTFPSVQGYKSLIDASPTSPDQVCDNPPYSQPSLINWRPTLCTVCCVPIDPPRDPDSRPCVALAACYHWFCEDCWRTHLTHKIDTGTLQPFTCPEYNCDSIVDHATTLSLIPTHLYRAYLQRIHDNRVQRSPDMVWCPNVKCGRVVRIDRDCVTWAGSACVVCDCGHSFCFLCHEPSHWPANCHDARLYHEKRVKLGDEDLIRFNVTSNCQTTVNVKNCPRCGEPIIKNAGCTHMQCRCGHEFCWMCGQEIPEASPCPLNYNTPVVNVDAYGTRQVTFSDEDRLKLLPRYCRSGQYLVALEHCRERNHGMMWRFRRQRTALCGTLKAKLMSKKRSGEALPSDRAVINREVDELLDTCMKLSVELHFIIEHTCVMIDSLHFRSPVIEWTLDRMTFIVTRIHQIFDVGTESGQKNIFARLSLLKSQARDCIVQLVNAVAQIQHR